MQITDKWKERTRKNTHMDIRHLETTNPRKKYRHFRHTDITDTDMRRLQRSKPQCSLCVIKKSNEIPVRDTKLFTVTRGDILYFKRGTTVLRITLVELLFVLQEEPLSCYSLLTSVLVASKCHCLLSKDTIRNS